LKFSHDETKPGTVVTLNHFEKAEAYSKNNLNIQQQAILQNVEQLIEGFESPYGLELIATVDFISQEKGIKDLDKIMAEIGQWTKRKKEIMKPFHIKVAHQRLQEYYQNQNQKL